MASSHFSIIITTKPNLQTHLFSSSHKKPFHFVSTNLHYSQQLNKGTHENNESTRRRRRRRSFGIRVSNDGDSYLDMWKGAVDRDRKETEFQKIVAESSLGGGDENVKKKEEEDDPEALEKKSDLFNKILEVPKEERDRIQRIQVIDRAAAALAAAQAILKESPIVKKKANSDTNGLDSSKVETNGEIGDQQEGTQGGIIYVTPSGNGTPGPDFWSWTPPVDDNTSIGNLQKAEKPNSSPKPVYSVMEKDRTIDSLSIPFQSTVSEKHNPPLPPLQSLTLVGNPDLSSSTLEAPTVEEQREHDLSFSVNAAEAAEALIEVGEASPLSEGVYVDGSKWWKETGIDVRPDGVVCRWTLTRGISADQSVEWEEKFWEAAGASDYKELGSEKSGRDATGNVWREYWKESMWQDVSSGLVHMEKSADKWGKNGIGGEWHEKWWEHYDASGKAEKWAHKWCSIDPNTPLDAGHAHVWHERWGETYDGQGASTKYTDKWAERSEGDGWAKWGDKWDENFNQYGQGVKQGETWWQGKYGDRWNRTWGEGHNGSGWIHKYGKSSCGEHWDTHVQQETWYERYPHFGFDHCFENSRQLREVGKPPENIMNHSIFDNVDPLLDGLPS